MCLFSNVSNRVLKWKEDHWLTILCHPFVLQPGHLEASNWDLKNHWVMSHMLLTVEMLRLRLGTLIHVGDVMVVSSMFYIYIPVYGLPALTDYFDP